MSELTYTVPAHRAGTTVYHVLRRDMALSATLTRRLKQSDAIFVDGVPAFTNRVLAEGEHVTVSLSAAEQPTDIVPESGAVEVCWETDGYLALNKPAGVLVHPTHSRNTGTLANFAAQYLLDHGEDGVCHAVNRLDRDTSGVVLFAKNAHTKDLGMRALPEAEKIYLAAVYGRPAEASGVIDLPIRRVNETDMRRMVSPDGQSAVTRYEVLKTVELQGMEASLLRLRLETGRTHQIRVHMAALGHPLLGDRLYGTEASLALSAPLGLTAHLLHARSFAFTDRMSGQRVKITAPVHREDFEIFLREVEF